MLRVQIAVFRRTRYNAGFIPPDSARFHNMPRYNPAAIEPKWQQYWETNRTFAAPRLPKGPKMYVLDMFPYPSGAGLHVGHPEGYTATDIVCRYRRKPGLQRHAPHGLGRLRAAGRATRQEDRHASAHHDREQHRHLPPPVEDAGLQLRLGPRAGHHRRGLLPLDAVHLPACSSTPGSTPSRRRAGRSPNCRSPTKSPSKGPRPSIAIATSIAWPTRSRPRSIGARPWARCWPTKR